MNNGASNPSFDFRIIGNMKIPVNVLGLITSRAEGTLISHYTDEKIFLQLLSCITQCCGLFASNASGISSLVTISTSVDTSSNTLTDCWSEYHQSVGNLTELEN